MTLSIVADTAALVLPAELFNDATIGGDKIGSNINYSQSEYF